MRIGRFLRPGRAARALARDEAGVSAIEFGLVAPMIFFSLLAMTDLGFALRERMGLDHVLRSGAQAAMRDAGEAAVLDSLKKSTCRPGESYPACSNPAGVTFDPAPGRYCYCPTTETKDTTCTSTCAVQPQKFYVLTATKTYEGIFLPDIAFAPEVLVEVR